MALNPQALRESLQRDQLTHALTASNKSLKSTNAFLRRELKEAEERLDVALALRQPSRAKPIRITAKSGASESAACVVLGDWHTEETVEGKTINGMNRFNLRIADQRITACAANAITLINLARAGTKIDTLVVALLGDFLTGYIHEELVEGNGLSPIEAVLWIKIRLTALLRHLQKHSGCSRIIVPAVVGNHGRTTQKPRVATATKNSYEWLLYKILADEMPELEWHVGDGKQVWIEVFGAKWRIHHGDSIKYQGGVGGITIPVNKAISQWDKTQRADLDIFGHWHQSLALRKFICNGCLIGYNAYALEIKADYEPPSQTFFLWEKEHGRTLTTPIFL